MSTTWKVALETLGCKLNQAETESMSRNLRQRGYQVVGHDAHIYILNTCTVTHVADSKARQALRGARCRHPQAWMVATGCYAQRSPQEIASIPGVDMVLGNRDKPHLIDFLEEKFPSGQPPSPSSKGLRTRSQLKVQEGCSQGCSYCIVPQVRGAERSLSAEAIIAEVRQREAEGYQEVVLTGSNIGNYRWQGIDLEGLIREVLARTAMPRLRLSSLQPQHLSASFLSLWQDGRLCPHFHLPLQSGSDSILRAMGRPYTVGDFRQAVHRLRDMVPQVAITTDVMVGFPGEDETDFEASLALCQELGLARVHAFPFSPRPGTLAAHWPGVPHDTKERRKQKLLSLARGLVLSFSQRFLDQEASVLWENEEAPGVWSGLTPNYLKVFTASEKALAHRITSVQLSHLASQGVWGEVT